MSQVILVVEEIAHDHLLSPVLFPPRLPSGGLAHRGHGWVILHRRVAGNLVPRHVPEGLHMVLIIILLVTSLVMGVEAGGAQPV